MTRKLSATEVYEDKRTRIAYDTNPPKTDQRREAQTDQRREANDLEFKIAPGTYTPVCVLHGAAGTGKTYKIQQYQADHPDENIMLTATTGVAAINIGPGCVTINSALKYFNEDDLPEVLQRKGKQIANDLQTVGTLVIDEMSMLSATALELIYGFIDRVNSSSASKTKLVLSGDFCQLPPIPKRGANSRRNEEIPFAFKSGVWSRVFDPAMMKLTVNHRQAGDSDFQQALHLARHGDSAGCVHHLKCNYARFVDMDFQGLTLYAVNSDCDLHNNSKLKALPTELIKDEADVWGETMAREWKDQLQPLYVKIGAQVRVTANDTPNFVYVNGDIATLIDYKHGLYALVELHRTKQQVIVGTVTRLNTRNLRPGERAPETCNGWDVPRNWSGDDAKLHYDAYIAAGMESRQAFYDPKTRKWVVGAITYVPIALGWASTVHKAQGLTVTAVQIDIADKFAGAPQMMYVALSRCREVKNITITRGDQRMLSQRIHYHPDIKKFM